MAAANSANAVAVNGRRFLFAVSAIAVLAAGMDKAELKRQFGRE